MSEGKNTWVETIIIITRYNREAERVKEGERGGALATFVD